MARRRRRNAISIPDFSHPPEVIVVMEEGAQIPIHPDAPPTDESDLLNEALGAEDLTLIPLFGFGVERIVHEMASVAPPSGSPIPDLSRFLTVPNVAPEQIPEMMERIQNLDAVQAAYWKPPAEPPMFGTDAPPLAEAPPFSTPDFSNRQGYLDAAPGGIDARFAWTVRGGRGEGVHIIDIEGDWQFTHEDLIQNQGGMVGGTPGPGWRNHGTAVIGEISGDDNGFGVTGIAPDANIRAISIFVGSQPNSANAIRQAADMLQPGDIILIELHRPGPRHNFQQRNDQRGYVAVEWWPDDYAAIRYATQQRGVIVVEAAGNGAENLDDSLYDQRPSQFTFPTWWQNPYRRSPLDSGAVVVGAGAPPSGADRSRLGFSNFGMLVDAQAWGSEVTTTGYGDLQGGPDENRWYTATFGGTSGASPIVVGAIACVQGHRRASGQVPWTPAEARERLRATGSPQTNPSTGRIGNRPNLRELISAAPTECTDWVSFFSGTLGGHQSHRWFTEGWASHVQVQWRVVPRTGSTDLQLDVERFQETDGSITWFLDVRNNGAAQATFEVQYCVA